MGRLNTCKHILVYILVILAVMAVSVVFSFFLVHTLGFTADDRSILIHYFQQFGSAAPAALIVLTILEAVIAPLPGGVLPVVAGFLFGTFTGAFYAWAGNVIGSSVAFFIAYMFGARVVRFFAPRFKEKRYQEIVTARSAYFWVFYFLPLLPVDVLSFALGLSRMKYRKFLVMIALGFMVRMSLLSFFGDSLAKLLFVL
ncbi:TVP38/TMEM64 family protein [Candidatus Uhrbacteria bacterium]|nr:TVP38/TMEM64 family protein [Candidatus Uhrbacteria bacterium]MBI2175490.1 TVP38/TMEM64 family protein [Parcubacteria group bacterium]